MFLVMVTPLVGVAVTWISAPTAIVAFALQWFYFTAFELWWNGQTPGKRAVGIRVIRGGGYPVGLFAAMVRNLVRMVDALPGPYSVGLTVAFLDPRRRRLGDLAAGTVVVRVRQPELAFLARTGRPPPEGAPWAPYLASVRSEGPMREVIHTYLARRGRLDEPARQRVRAEIVQNLLLDVTDPAEVDALVATLGADEQDRFLEAIIGWDRNA